MKTIILAGGFGTRLAELTANLPKPMVEIGGKPVLWHILNCYSAHGYNEFIIALGYKSEVIKKYFLDFKNSGIDVKLNNMSITEFYNKIDKSINTNQLINNIINNLIIIN